MTHDVEDLALYGYCSLRYRYKVVWKLPYREESPRAAYAEAIRRAISRLLYGLSDTTASNAKAAALRLFNTLWSRACKGMPWDPEILTGMRIEGHLALHDMFQRIGSDDQVLGGSLPAEVAIGDSLVLRSTVDGMIMRSDSDAYRTLCIVHVTDEKSPLATPRYQPLKRQWTIEVVRKQLKFRDKQIAHWVFSPFTHHAPKLYDAPSQRMEFVEAARALAHGVDAKVFIQTPHRERCRSCWYRNICSARHCGTVSQREIDELAKRS
jgi:hypothetical protein